MQITISAELEAQLQQKAAAQGLTLEAYVERLIREEAEYEEIRAAVSEGLAQAERGEGKPAREVFAELRGRHGVPR